MPNRRKFFKTCQARRRVWLSEDTDSPVRCPEPLRTCGHETTRDDRRPSRDLVVDVHATRSCRKCGIW